MPTAGLDQGTRPCRPRRIRPTPPRQRQRPAKSSLRGCASRRLGAALDEFCANARTTDTTARTEHGPREPAGRAGGFRYDADRQDAHRRPPMLYPRPRRDSSDGQGPHPGPRHPPARLRAGAGCPERLRHATQPVPRRSARPRRAEDHGPQAQVHRAAARQARPGRRPPGARPRRARPPSRRPPARRLRRRGGDDGPHGGRGGGLGGEGPRTQARPAAHAG